MTGSRGRAKLSAFFYIAPTFTNADGQHATELETSAYS